MQIRKAEEKDLEQIEKLYAILFREMAALQPQTYRPANQSRQLLLSIMKNKKSDILVAMDGTLKGFALIQEQETPAYGCMVPHRYAYLMDVATMPGERGKGIGRELLKAAEAWADQRKLDYVELSAVYENREAISFYAREGYRGVMTVLRRQPEAAGTQDKVHIRPMRESDAPVVSAAFLAQGWDKPQEQYEEYFKEQCEKKRKVLIAEYEGTFAGYVTVLPGPLHGPFAGKGIPEIADFNVLLKYQRKGIGSRLLDEAERLAAAGSDTVCLGVGLHNGYGPAQRIYVKRGYVPDGSGVWYRSRNLAQEAECQNDDDLVLYFSKNLG